MVELIKRAEMSKLVSFSVWGDRKSYLDGSIENIHLCKEIYPGWDVRFYCDEEVSRSFMKEAESLGAQIVVKKTISSPWEGLFWRFLPAGEQNVDIFISRDIDSRVNVREQAAVNEWLRSDKPLHCMRDHVEHNVPILGGMWGCKKGILIDMPQFIDEWQKKDYKGCDQDFLREVVWDKLKKHALVHDKFYQGLTIINGEMKEGYIFHYDPPVVQEGEEAPPPPQMPEYIYDPLTFFGPHELRPFPPHEKMTHGVHVGEIIQ